MHFLTLLLAVCLLFSPAKVLPQPANTLRFCVEESEFPPFNYRQRNISSPAPLVGYDIDILRRVFVPAQINYDVVALPWRRCLKEVQQGLIDGAMSASLNPQRKQDFLPSVPYYFLHPSFYYLKADYPQGLSAKQAEQLSTLGPVCGISGFNYDNFGFNNLKTIYRIKDVYLLPKMLAQKRCAFFLARSEIFTATVAIRQLHHLTNDLAEQRLEQVEPESFHLLVSPLSPEKDQILSLFNKKIMELEASGQLNQLLEYHLYLLTQFEP